MPKQSNIILRGRRRYPEGPKRLIQVHLGARHRDFLADLYIATGLTATALIERGLSAFGVGVVDMPPASSPYSVSFGLRLGVSEGAPHLAVIAKETGLSQAEVVRRLIERAEALWNEEQLLPRPFSHVFLQQAKALAQGKEG